MAKIPQRAQDLAAAARARSGDTVERALDRVFLEPFDVPDADTALRLLTDARRPQPSAALRFLEGQALVRIAGQVAKLAAKSKAAGMAARVAALPGASSAGTTAAAAGGGMSAATSMGATALAAAAVTAATRTGRTVKRGVTDLQVLASYLASRARREQVTLGRELLRAITLAVYVDPRRRIDFSLAGRKGASSVLARWSRDTVSAQSEARRNDEARAWIDAIDRLDLRTFAAAWERRGATDLETYGP
jgi:hypothetical protein